MPKKFIEVRNPELNTSLSENSKPADQKKVKKVEKHQSVHPATGRIME